MTSTLAVRKTSQYFVEAMEHQRGDVLKALTTTVEALNVITKYNRSGSTLSLVYVSEDRRRAFVAVLGDSPVIIKGRNDRICTSPTHNIRANPKELKAAFKKGAVYYRGYIFDPSDRTEGLQMSRSLGDRQLNKVLNRQPEVYSVALGKRSFVMVATDGVYSLWPENELDRQIVNALERNSHLMDITNKIHWDSITDNMTLILWRPNRK
jgi:serine/threonine protein phosphatase PrpC